MFAAPAFGNLFRHYVLVYGRKGSSDKLASLYRSFLRPFDGEECATLITTERESFFNWMMVTVNHMTRAAARGALFNWTFVAHHRGLSRSGMEYLADKGVLLKRTLYNQMLNERHADLVREVRYIPLFFFPSTHSIYILCVPDRNHNSLIHA